jgi:ZIP family zinc transporter
MQAVLFSLLATIVGTLIGSLVAVCAGNRSPKIINYLLSLAAGVMLSLVFFDIIPEVLEIASVPLTVLGVGIGIVIILIFDTVSDKMTDGKDDEISQRKAKNEILRSGYIMLAAIGIHNLPAGFAIGAGSEHHIGFAATMALTLAMHNLPEGMATAALLLAGGVKKRNAVLLSALTGAPTILGAAIGYFVGNMSDVAMALTTSAVAGIILYMIFEEILPQGAAINKTRITTIFTLLGIIIGVTIFGR